MKMGYANFFANPSKKSVTIATSLEQSRQKGEIDPSVFQWAGRTLKISPSHGGLDSM